MTNTEISNNNPEKGPILDKSISEDKTKQITFHRAQYGNPALSPSHMRILLETYIGPVSAIVKSLEDNPSKLSLFRSEMEVLLGEYFENNAVIQSFLMTRAIKL